MTGAQPAVAPVVPAAPVAPLAPAAPIAPPPPIVPTVAIEPPTPTADIIPSAPSPASESDHGDSPTSSQKHIDDEHRPVGDEDNDWSAEDDKSELPYSSEYESEEKDDEDDESSTEDEENLPPTSLHGPMGSQWNDLPVELRIRIYPESGFKKILKRIPGSKRDERGDFFDAMVALYVVDSGIQFTCHAEFHAVRALERDYNKVHNHQLKVFVHWDCNKQLVPFYRLIKEAVFADIAWKKEHGDTSPPERKEPCINVPIQNYLRRTHPQGADLVLPGLERQALEDLVEIAVHRFYETSPPRAVHPEPIIINILVPTRPEFEPAVGSAVYELLSYPFNNSATGIVWRWPDPRTIQHIMESAAVENPTFPARVYSTIQDNLLSNEFRYTLFDIDPDPPLPYLIGRHDMTQARVESRQPEDDGFWDFLFEKDRRIYAAFEKDRRRRVAQEIHEDLFGHSE